MAEVRQCFLRVKHVFGHYFCQQSVLWSHSGHGKCLLRSSKVAAAFVLAASSNGGAVASQDGYTSSRTSDQGVLNTSKDSCNPPHNQAHERYLLKTLTQHRVKVWRTLFSGNLCVQHFNWSPSAHTRAYSGNGPRAEPLYKSKSGYYEVLEVLPSATQAQIKTAYYKQSFTFHPDRNPGSDDATTRFSEISEAYTVLGNKGLRKKYDRGLLSLSDLTATPPRSSSSKDPTAGPTKQRRSQTVVGSHAGGGVFDFDTFFQSHYREQLQRQKDLKSRKEEIERKKVEELKDMQLGRLMEIGVGLLLMMACALLFNLK